MVMQNSDAVWLISVIALSIGGTFAIIYIIKHFTDYFDNITEIRKNNLSFFASISSAKP
jgi:hypothetical protein